MWYIYGETRVSKRTFEDEFFREMLTSQNPQAFFVARGQMKYHVAAELQLFEVAFSWMTEMLHREHYGNPFAQGMHDGVTLTNRRCYQSMASQQIFRGESYTLAFAFKQLREHHAGVVSAAFTSAFEARTSISCAAAFWAMISDLAALAVASELDIEDVQKCKLHQGGKVGDCAMGLLVKTRNKVVLNPFPEGEALYKKMHKLACEFSYGARNLELMDLCKEYGMKEVLPKVDLCGTRMTSLYGLFHANLRLRPAMEAYLARETAKVADLTTAKGMAQYERLISITPDDTEWRSAAEAEAGLSACKS
jgi:hypothetical protein